MPTQTFFNLPEEKRQRIIRAAVMEFAANLFNKSSVARIVKNAGIPRGSFYQYFFDLKDLYKYVFSLAGEEKLKFFYQKVPKFQEDNLDFFQTLKALYVAGIQFAEDHPELTAIGNNFFKEDEAFKHELMGEHELKAEQFFADLIQKGIGRGQLDPSLNPSLTSYLMVTLNMSLVNYYLNRLKATDILASKEDLLQLADDMLNLIANGIKSNEPHRG